MDLNRRDVARLLLELVPVSSLRKVVRHSRRWQSIFHGFRPDYLTRIDFVRAAEPVSRDPRMLEALGEVYLDSLGIPTDSDTKNRFMIALNGKNLQDNARRVCLQLSTATIWDLPEEKESIAASPPNNSSDIDDRVVVAQELVPTEDQPSVVVAKEYPTEAEENPASQASLPASSDSQIQLRKPAELPECVRQRIMLEWEPPTDHVTEAHECVSLFERALVALVYRQLKGYYGDAWLRQGCGKLRDRWRQKAGRNQAVEPKSLLGYADIGELAELIVDRGNWPAFREYFEDKTDFERHVESIIGFRVSADHPGQREVYFAEQYAALREMVVLAERFHPETAHRIDEIFREVVTPDPPEEPEFTTAGSKILTNLGEFQPPEVIGREQELRQIREFWDEDYARVLSISGEGGLGKTAILDAFTRELLSRPCAHDARPDPEMIVYLTAKDNYLYLPSIHGTHPAPDAMRFNTLPNILETTLGLAWGPSIDIEDKRRSVLDLARNTRIFFALDNLESLSDSEWDAISTFLADLPAPSKAIVTTRIRKHTPRKITLAGLSKVDARELLLRRVSEHGLELDPQDDNLDAIYELTGGSPLATLFIANMIIGGRSLQETVHDFRGQSALGLLEFSFESSLSQLDQEAVAVLYYLSLSDRPRTRNNIVQIGQNELRIDDILQTMIDMSFVDRISLDRHRLGFSVRPLVVDYVRRRAPNLLPSDVLNWTLAYAKVIPTDAGSPSVRAEVDKAIAAAAEVARFDRSQAITVLEQTREMWGDDPALLEKLGYQYYRAQNRKKARDLYEKAITLGHESPELHAYLALVLFYEREYDHGLEHAERALTFRTPYPFADQVAGQCLLTKARSSAFLLSSDLRLKAFQSSLIHFRRSLIAEERIHHDRIHNERSKELIKLAEVEIAQIQKEAARR